MKNKTISLIVGLVCIIVGLLIFNTCFVDYKEQKAFFANAETIDGVVNTVQKKGNKQSFEYRYEIKGQSYKKYVSDIKYDKDLKDGDIINVYYDKDDNGVNTIRELDKTLLYVGIGILVLLVVFGTINIIKYIKK